MYPVRWSNASPSLLPRRSLSISLICLPIMNTIHRTISLSPPALLSHRDFLFSLPLHDRSYNIETGRADLLAPDRRTVIRLCIRIRVYGFLPPPRRQGTYHLSNRFRNAISLRSDSIDNPSIWIPSVVYWSFHPHPWILERLSSQIFLTSWFLNTKSYRIPQCYSNFQISNLKSSAHFRKFAAPKISELRVKRSEKIQEYKSSSSIRKTDE